MGLEMGSQYGGNRQQIGGGPAAHCGVRCVQAAIIVSTMKMHLRAEERLLLGVHHIEREISVCGSSTSTQTRERYRRESVGK